jgi:chromate transporter
MLQAATKKGKNSLELFVDNSHALQSEPPGSGPARGVAAGKVELARLFLKLGLIAFGGPAAHIAMMENEVVRRRRWLSQEEFLDLLGAVNLIPGPNSTEMAIFIGYRRAGALGLLLAGGCFILPAVVIVSIIAWAYQKYGTLPQAEALFYGIKPVIIAIVVQALWRLGRSAVKSRFLAFIGLSAVVASGCGINPLIVLFSGGALMILWRAVKARPKGIAACLMPVFGAVSGILPGAATGETIAATTFSNGALFLFFLKVGAVLFGSGYVLLAFLRADLVEHRHWLTENQLLDAVAVGQFTPGPVFTTATFIGYILGGPVSAIVATVGIFLPSFVFVALSGPLIPRLRQSPVAGAFLDGVNVASLALMAVVTWQLGGSAIMDTFTLLLAMATAFVLIRFRTNSAWLVLGGAVLGLVARFFHPHG